MWIDLNPTPPLNFMDVVLQLSWLDHRTCAVGLHVGAVVLKGLLDEMETEAWQATLSFFSEERWRKFVYSCLAD